MRTDGDAPAPGLAPVTVRMIDLYLAQTICTPRAGHAHEETGQMTNDRRRARSLRRHCPDQVRWVGASRLSALPGTPTAGVTLTGPNANRKSAHEERAARFRSEADTSRTARATQSRMHSLPAITPKNKRFY